MEIGKIGSSWNKKFVPEMIETLKSTEILSKEGFKVMVYCSDDPLMAKRLENAGACAIIVAAPIGSGLGIQNKVNIKIIRKQPNYHLLLMQALVKHQTQQLQWS